MRFTLTIEIARDRPESPPEREVDMAGAVTELAETHPPVDRPIGFRYDPEGE